MADSPITNEPGAVSASFDGSTGYISSNTNIPTGVGAKCMLSCWVKQASIPTVPVHLISQDGISANRRGALQIASTTGAAVGFFSDGATLSIATSASNICDDTWHHVAVTIDTSGDGFARLYVDGALETTASASITQISTAAISLEIGRAQNSDRYFGGLLAEFKLYNTALSATDILELYQAPTLT